MNSKGECEGVRKQGLLHPQPQKSDREDVLNSFYPPDCGGFVGKLKGADVLMPPGNVIRKIIPALTLSQASFIDQG